MLNDSTYLGVKPTLSWTIFSVGKVFISVSLEDELYHPERLVAATQVTVVSTHITPAINAVLGLKNLYFILKFLFSSFIKISFLTLKNRSSDVETL